MRFLFRWAFRFLILFIVLAVALLLSKDALLQSFAEIKIRKETGMDVKIGSVKVGLFSPTVTVENFRLFNPAEFGGSPLLEMPDLHVEYSPAALAFRKLRLKLVRVAVSEINIVESLNGQTNLVLSVEDLEPVAPREAAEPVSVLGLAFQEVEVLNLTLGKARFTSLRQPGSSTEVHLGLKNEILTNIKSMAQLRQVLMRALLRNGITITEPPANRRPARGR